MSKGGPMAFTQTVSEDEGQGSYGFRCSHPCGFTSTHWETEDLATKRAAQHQNEHETLRLMPTPADFLEGKQGVDDGPSIEEVQAQFDEEMGEGTVIVGLRGRAARGDFDLSSPTESVPEKATAAEAEAIDDSGKGGK